MFYRPAEGHGLPHSPFSAIVSPRPIGWISTRASTGDNLAPYSFFNAVGYTPPQVMFAGDYRDSMVNAMENRLVANVYRVTAIKIRMTAQSRVRVTRQNATRVIKEHLAFLMPLLAGDEDGATRGLSHHIDQSLTLALGGTL